MSTNAATSIPTQIPSPLVNNPVTSIMPLDDCVAASIPDAAFLDNNEGSHNNDARMLPAWRPFASSRLCCAFVPG